MNNNKLLVQKEMTNIIEWYKWLHQNPELSGNEQQTKLFVKKKLLEAGINKIEEYAETGIVCELSGSASGKHIAFRAELDALPLNENNDIVFCSKNQGIMHACGHDFHTAAMLGLATILSKNRDLFTDKITFVFQPSEETIPSGALQMLEAGIFKDNKPDIMIAQHVFPDLPTGSLGFRTGKYMASGDEIEITVNGKGGHGAFLHLSNDVVLALSHIIVALQQIKSHFVEATEPFVLSFGKLEALGATNILPNSAQAWGTMRTLNETWRAKAKQQIQNIVSNVAEAYGCSGHVNIKQGFPVLENNETLTNTLSGFAKELLGKYYIHDLPIRMGTDDFAYFAETIPSVYYRVGVASDNNKNNLKLHTNTFLPDISALETAIFFPLSIVLNSKKIFKP